MGGDNSLPIGAHQTRATNGAKQKRSGQPGTTFCSVTRLLTDYIFLLHLRRGLLCLAPAALADVVLDEKPREEREHDAHVDVVVPPRDLTGELQSTTQQ